MKKLLNTILTVGSLLKKEVALVVKPIETFFGKWIFAVRHKEIGTLYIIFGSLAGFVFCFLLSVIGIKWVIWMGFLR